MTLRHVTVSALIGALAIGAYLAALALISAPQAHAMSLGTTAATQAGTQTGNPNKTAQQIRSAMQQRHSSMKALRQKHRALREEFVTVAKAYRKGNATKQEFEDAQEAYKVGLTEIRDEYKELREEWRMQRKAMKANRANLTQQQKDRLKAAREEYKKARAERFQKRCELRNNRQAAVQGFAVPYKVHSVKRQLMMTVACDPESPDFTLEVGTGEPTEYIYKYGYLYDSENRKWKRFEFETIDGEEVGSWIKGDAYTDLEASLNITDEETHVVAYICSWTGTEWKCGCSDQQCRTPKWMLQTVPSYNSIAPAPGTNPGSSGGSTSGGGSSSSTSGGGSTSSSSGGSATTTATSTSSSSSSTSSGGSTTQAQTVTIDISSENFEFDVENITVNKGDTVVINLTNDEGVHDWVIDEFDAKTDVLDTQGQTDSVSFVADQSGTFEYYCSVPGHRQLGMVGTLTVN